MFRKTRYVLAIAGVVLLLFGCPSKKSGTGADSIEHIKLAAETSLLTSTVWVAEAKGYFKDEGLDVDIEALDSGRNCLETMLTPGSDVDIASVAQTPVVFSSFHDSNFVIIAAMAFSTDDTKVLARAPIASPRDLAGKRIGTTLRSTAHYFLDGFLEHHGLRLEEVELVDINASQLPRALVDGKVDAITIWEPHIYNSRKELGTETRRFLSPTPFRKEFYFAVKKDYAKSNQSALEKFLRALIRAEGFILAHPEEARAIVTKRLGMDKALVDAIWGSFMFNICLEQATFTVLESEANWAVKHGLASGVEPNYLDFIDASSLRKIRPSSVTLSR